MFEILIDRLCEGEMITIDGFKCRISDAQRTVNRDLRASAMSVIIETKRWAKKDKALRRQFTAQA